MDFILSIAKPRDIWRPVSFSVVSIALLKYEGIMRSTMGTKTGWSPSLVLLLLVHLCSVAIFPVSTVQAGNRPGPSLDIALGMAHLRTGWGPGLELRPGYAIGDKWLVYATFSYAIHAIDFYHNDAAGFVGFGFGHFLRPQSELPILVRAGLTQFAASYENRPDPPEGPLGFQVGFDVKWAKHFACGAGWTFQANSPQDGILLIPITLCLQW